MYAIVATSGKQFRVTEGDRIVVDRVPARVGETVRLESVLLVGGDSSLQVGKPFVPGAAVEATVLAHRPGKKLIVYKYRPKKRFRSKEGYRRLLSELKIAAIRTPGGETALRPETPAEPLMETGEKSEAERAGTPRRR